MSAIRLQLITLLCLSFGAPSRAARTAADVEGVVRRNVGQSVTIQCKSASTQDALYFRKGLNEEEDIFFTNSLKTTIDKNFNGRLLFHGKFPSVDILIKNLTLDDTGPYWCVYKRTDNYALKTTKGSGSMLLVVTENRPSPIAPECDPPLVLVSVVICAAVLIVILTASLIGIIIKNKPWHNKARTRRDESI